MRKKLHFLLTAFFAVSMFTASIQAQTMLYSENFTSGSSFCPGSSQYDNWGTFRASLDTNTISFISCTIRGTLDAVGVTCADPAIVSQIAAALHDGTQLTFTCNGRLWTVGNACITGCAISGDDIELNAANTGTDCSCGGDYTVRPCIGNGNWGGIIGGGCGAATQTMEVEFLGLPPIPFDGGVVAVNTPVVPSCAYDTNFLVSVKQFGYDTITSIEIGWSVNGVMQPVTNWTGSLIEDQVMDSIAIGTYAFGPNDTILVWTINPNMTLDSNDFNDTLSLTLPGLAISGTFTIDTNAVTAGNNFHSFADAIHLLDSLGICDSVIIDVAVGTFTEQISIPQILGAGPNSPIIIRGNTSDTSRLDFSSTSSALDYTLELAGAQWFIFEDMYFSASGASYAHAVEFAGDANNNHMKNCVFMGYSATNSTSVNYATVYANGTTNSSNSFTNCDFMGGSYGIYWRGQGQASLNEDCMFDSCQFLDWYYMGSYTEFTNNLVIRNSRYVSNSLYTGTSYGIYNQYGDGAQEINNNRVERDTTDVPKYGMYISNSDATNGSPGLISNNTVVVGDSASSSTFYGMYLQTSSFQNVYHNSLVTIGGGTGSRTLYSSSGGGNRLANNNIVNLGNGHALYLGSTFSLLSSDHNNLYADSADIGFIGTTQVSLQDWQVNSGMDINSVSVNANFTDVWNNDLHVCNDTLNNAGLDLQGVVMLDFDGETRNQATPDIGADEFTGLGDYTFAQDTIVFCPGSSTVLMGATDGASNLWSTGDTTNSITVLTAGTWTLTVTGTCGSITDSVVTVISGPTATVTVTDQVSCNGLSDGEASVVGSGGTMPYGYQWSNTSITDSIGGLIAGSYSVTLTDNNGCTATDIALVTEPTVLVSSALVSTNPTCNGSSNGGVTVTANGGNLPYTYLWSTSDTTATVGNLGAGTYSVTVTDAEGCSSPAAVAIANPAALLTFTSVDSNVSCFGASDGGASVLATGGSTPYSYVWSTSATTASITGLMAGSYFVTVTDFNGCSTMDTVIVLEPTMLVATAAVTNNVSCNGLNDGVANGSATGGTMPYVYSWSNGSVTATNAGLIAGTYTVTVTDANGCSAMNSISITEPLMLNSIVVGTDVTCTGLANGTGSITVTGGTSPYSYVWNDPSLLGSSVNGLVAGSYSVTISDANGCSMVESVLVGTMHALPVVSLGSDTSFCLADTISLDGGTGFTSYQWSNGETTSSISVSTVGVYWLAVSDVNGCTNRDTVVLNNYPVFALATSVQNVVCELDSNGSAMANVAGGTSPFTYLWDDQAAQITANASNLPEGTFSVRVTDANGCSDAASVIVDFINPRPTLNLIDLDTICDPYSYTIISPAGFANYIWSTGDSTNTLEVDSSGTYMLTVTDANGCMNSDSIVLVSNPCLSVEEIAGNAQVSYFPNPTSGVVNMELVGMQGKSITLRVVTIQGQVILEEQINNLTGTFQKQMDLSNEAKGIYLIHVITEGHNLVNRVTVR